MFLTGDRIIDNKSHDLKQQVHHSLRFFHEWESHLNLVFLAKCACKSYQIAPALIIFMMYQPQLIRDLSNYSNNNTGSRIIAQG